MDGDGVDFFYRRLKAQLVYAGCVRFTDCFETYMIVTYLLNLCYHEKLYFDNMGPLKQVKTSSNGVGKNILIQRLNHSS